MSKGIISPVAMQRHMEPGNLARPVCHFAGWIGRRGRGPTIAGGQLWSGLAGPCSIKKPPRSGCDWVDEKVQLSRGWMHDGRLSSRWLQGPEGLEGPAKGPARAVRS